MTKRNAVKTLCSVLCIGALLCGGVRADWFGAPMTSSAESVDSLQDRKKQLEEEARRLQAKKDALSENINDQQQRKAYIEQQIALKEQEIEVNGALMRKVESAIEEKDAALAAKEAAIAAKEAEISDRFKQLQTHLRAISKTGNSSSLQMLLSTDDYVDYLLKTKIMNRIAAKDQELIAGLEKEIGAIRQEKDALEADKKEMESERAKLQEIQDDAEDAKNELDALCYEVRLVMYDLQSDLSYYNSQLEKVKEDEAALEREIERIIRESSGGGIVLSGKLQWPSNSCSIVTCAYGGRYLDGEYNFHKGIDIACYGSAYGKDIRSAGAGEVLYVNTGDSWGGGYGYYVMVDHGYDGNGDHIVTLYAHCSRILVRDGQYVSKGQQIAEIGNTGWSYGAHLHFEVRVNSNPVDPLTNGWVVIP